MGRNIRQETIEGLQLVCGRPTLALSSALVPQTLSCLVNQRKGRNIRDLSGQVLSLHALYNYRAAENRTSWKGIVANSSVVPPSSTSKMSKVKWYTYRGSNFFIVIFASHLIRGQLLKKRIRSPKRKFFPCMSRPYLKGLHCPGKQ